MADYVILQLNQLMNMDMNEDLGQTTFDQIPQEEGVEFVNCRRASQLTGVPEYLVRYYQRRGYIKSYEFGNRKYVAVRNGDLIKIVKVT